MRIVVALGGNALLRRGEPLTPQNQRANIRRAAAQLAPLVTGHEVVIAHGNGPQVGLLALQAAAAKDVPASGLDVLGAQTEAMIGYVIEQELGNLLPSGPPLATLLTMVEVDPADPAFRHPTKPIGPVYSAAEAAAVRAEHGWPTSPDGSGFRRVVPSPAPLRITELDAIAALVAHGTVVVCAGGGGIPNVVEADGTRRGVEAVVDKDATAAVLASGLGADLLVIATDVDAVYRDFGTPEAAPLGEVDPATLRSLPLAAGSMGPKVRAALGFVEGGGGRAAIGSLEELGGLVEGSSGTQLRRAVAPGSA